MEADSSPEFDLVRRIGLPIHQSRGWLKLLGVLSIVYGILAMLTIVGIIFAWLPIWLGVLLYQAAGLADSAYISGDEKALTAALGKLKTYITISGVLALLGLVFGALVFTFGLLGAILGVLGQ